MCRGYEFWFNLYFIKCRLAHRYYGHKNKDIILFDDIGELIDILKYLFYSENVNTQETIIFAEKYAIRNVVERFLEL